MKETSYEFKPILHDSKEKVEHLKDILIVRIEEPLNFANTGMFFFYVEARLCIYFKLMPYMHRSIEG